MFNKSSLSFSYWIVFFILAVWASFAYYTMHTMIASQQQYGALINLSGKQRMLSQRTALYAGLTLLDGAKLPMLTSLVETMKHDHSYITANLTSPRIEAYYFGANGLDAKVNRYFRLLDAFVEAPAPSSLAAVTRESNALLEHLNGAVTLFEQENSALVAELERQEQLIYFGTLLTLLLEAVLIISPMVRLHRNYLGKLEEAVAEQTAEIRIFANIFEHSKEGMIIADAQKKIINVNQAFTEITGYAKAEVLGKPINFCKSEQYDGTACAVMWQAIREQHFWEGEIVNLRRDGREVYEHHTIMKLNDGDSVRYVSVFTDVSERKFYENQLHRLANHDSLTGLLNRSEILNRIDHAIALTDRGSETLAVVFVDLDNFKLINDSMGHAAGDHVLIEISRRLSRSIRESDTLGRLGGDEFIVLIESLKKPGDEAVVLKKLLHAFDTPVFIEDSAVPVSASMGVIHYPQGESAPCTAQQLIRKADIAMYSAKESGKKQAAYYNLALEEMTQSRTMVSGRLSAAIEAGELELYLQPRIDLPSGKLSGAEALLRWNRDGMVVTPAQFIAIAEENDLIKQIDLWVVGETIRLLERIRHQGYGAIPLALNVSGRTFSDDDAMQGMLERIERSGLASSIEFEITERVLVENLPFAYRTIEKIRSTGVSVSLDDFGTGYSSFSYISNMPLDAIKIDRSFIGALDEPKQKILVEAMIDFSEKLGMKVTAEGIETSEQLEWLKHRRCDFGQGFLFSEPLPYREFEKLLCA